MTSDSVSLTQLVDWLSRFNALATGRDERMAAATTAVMKQLEAFSPRTIDELFKIVSMTLVSSLGRASGPAYGTFFLRFGMSAGPVSSLTAEAFCAALRAGLEGVIARGDAAPDDQTVADALTPAVEAFAGAMASGSDLAAAASLAAREVGSESATTFVLFEALASAVVVQ